MCIATQGHSSAGVDRGPKPVFQDVLCAVDGTGGSFVAVEQAATLAGPEGELTLLAVTAVTGGGQFHQAAISPARAERILDHAAQLARTAGVPSTSVIDPREPPRSVILDRAAEHDLLAIGAPATSRLTQLFVGGVAADAMAQLPCATLFSRRSPAAGGFAESILVASDASPQSDALVRVAARLAHERDSKVVLLHSDGGEGDQDNARLAEQEQMLEKAGGGSCELMLVSRPAHEAITEALSRLGASLALMASRRKSGLHAIGSVSARVVHGAPCSVLLIPPGGDG